jgi:hypothetical protein
MIGLQDYAAAEVLLGREISQEKFHPVEWRIVTRLIMATIRRGRTRLYLHNIEEFCELVEVPQKKIYGYLHSLMDDKVISRSPDQKQTKAEKRKQRAHGEALWFALNPPHQWASDRRRPVNEGLAKLCADLAMFDPEGAQKEIWEWPRLDEIMRQEFLRSSQIEAVESVPQTRGITEQTAPDRALHAGSGDPAALPGLKHESSESGSAEGSMLAPTRSGECAPSLRSDDQHLDGSEGRPLSGRYPVPGYHHEGGIGAAAVAKTDTTTKVVLPNTPTEVVSKSVGKTGPERDTPAVGVSAASRAGARSTLNEDFYNVQRLRGKESGKARPDTTAKVVWPRKAVSREEEMRLMAMILEFFQEMERKLGLRCGYAEAEMINSGSFWRTRIVRNGLGEELERAMGEGRHRVREYLLRGDGQGKRPFDNDNPARWLNNEVRTYAGAAVGWMGVPVGPSWRDRATQ